MFNHDKTQVSIKESHRNGHDKMKYEVKERHHDGGHIGMVAPPFVPGVGMGTVYPAPLPIVAPTAGHHEKFSLKIKERHGRRNSATTTTTTTAYPAGMMSETISTAPIMSPLGGMPGQMSDGFVRSPTENTYVYHDPPQFISPELPPVTTTYIVHEPVFPTGMSAPTMIPPAPIAPMAAGMPATGRHELRIKQKFRGNGNVGATVAPIPEFGAPLVPAPTVGRRDRFQFRLKEKHYA